MLSTLCRYADNFVCHVLSYRYGIQQHYEAAIKCEDFISGTCIRARARVLRARASDPSLGLDFEMDDTLSIPEPPREPEHPSVSLGCREFTGTVEVLSVIAIRVLVYILFYCSCTTGM